MIPDRVLESTIRTALAEEAKSMSIDMSSGAERFRREVQKDRLTRQGLVALAAAAAAVVIAVVVWSPWSSRSTPPALPAAGTSAPTTVAASDWPFTVDLATGARTDVPHAWLPDGYEFGTKLAVSPDGSQVAVGTCELEQYGCRGDSSLVVVAGTGTHRTVPLPSGGSVSAAVWSPDGRHVVYQVSSFPAGVGELFSFEVSTGRTVQITDLALDTASWWSLVWSVTNNGQVLYDLPTGTGTDAGWNVWQVPLAGGEPTLRVRNARAPEALPDGGLAYVVPRTGSWEGSAIAVVDRTGAARTTATARTGIGWVRVSPDGARLAYLDDDATWVVPVAGGAPRRVADGAVAQWTGMNSLLVLP